MLPASQHPSSKKNPPHATGRGGRFGRYVAPERVARRPSTATQRSLERLPHVFHPEHQGCSGLSGSAVAHRVLVPTITPCLPSEPLASFGLVSATMNGLSPLCASVVLPAPRPTQRLCCHCSRLPCSRTPLATGVQLETSRQFHDSRTLTDAGSVVGQFHPRGLHSDAGEQRSSLACDNHHSIYTKR